MRLSLIYENSGTGQYVYHRTNSFYSVYDILTSGKINGLIPDWDADVGTSRMSTALSLDDSKRLWEFGPYIIEIFVSVVDGGGANEFVLTHDIPHRFTRWGIDFSPSGVSQYNIKWFNVDDVRNFDHRRFDHEVLRSFRDGATELGYCWLKDFMNGDWPELTDNQVGYDYGLTSYRKLPSNERRKWGIHFRRSLYGMDLDEDD